MAGPSLNARFAYRLACADSAFPRLSHAGALAVIRDLDIPAVDICVSSLAHTSPDLVRSAPRAVADRVRCRLDRVGLRVADVFLILGIEDFRHLAVNHPDPRCRAESLEHFKQAVEFAHMLGSPGITVLPGMPFEGFDGQRSLELAAAELQLRVELAGEAGLGLSVEPHYQSIAQTPQATCQLLEQAPGLWLALDPSHFIYQGIAQQEFDLLFPRTRHVHLRQAAPAAMQLPVREGVIDFPRWCRSLQAGGCRGYFTLEYQWEEWLDCRRVDCISETAELRDLLLAAYAADEAVHKELQRRRRSRGAGR